MEINKITDERGSNYGHPLDHFTCTQDMYDRWMDKRELGRVDVDCELLLCLNHIVYMIIDKLVRAAQNPLHMDNFVDIQGYASLWEKCVSRSVNPTDILHGELIPEDIYYAKMRNEGHYI